MQDNCLHFQYRLSVYFQLLLILSYYVKTIHIQYIYLNAKKPTTYNNCYQYFNFWKEF